MGGREFLPTAKEESFPKEGDAVDLPMGRLGVVLGQGGPFPDRSSSLKAKKILKGETHRKAHKKRAPSENSITKLTNKSRLLSGPSQNLASITEQVEVGP